MGKKFKYKKIQEETKVSIGSAVSSLKRIFNYSAPYLRLIILGNFFLILLTATSVLIPKYVGHFTDTVNGKESDYTLDEITTLVAGLFVCTIIFEIIKDYFFDILALKVVKDMKEDLFTSLMEKDIEFYDNRNTGELMSRITSDIVSVQNSSITDVSNLIRRIFEIIGSLILMIKISPWLTLMSFICIPLILMMVIISARIRKRRSRVVSDAASESSKISAEAFQNIRIVKAFSTEDKEIKDYVKSLEKVYDLEFAALKTISYVTFGRGLFALIGIYIMIYMGSYMVKTGTMTAGDLTSFLMYCVTMTNGFSFLDKTIKRFSNSLGSAENIFQIIDYVPSITQNRNGHRKEGEFKGQISVKDVSFSYPSKTNVTVLENANLTISEGQTVAMVGASGSGKSTIVSLLERFYDTSDGAIEYDGVNVKKYDLKWLHKQIGFVSQEPTLFSGTIKENILYGVEEFNQDLLDEAIRMANASFIYDSRQFPEALNSVVGERGVKLSGGQKQRIAIARALVKNPKILIFDEATSALDSESEHQVQSAIDQLVKKGDKTVIIIAHRLSTVKNCDKIFVFAKGKIVEEGNHHELLDKNGIYKHLVERQLSGLND